MDQSLWSSVLPYVGEIYSYLQKVQMQILKDECLGTDTEPNLIHALYTGTVSHVDTVHSEGMKLAEYKIGQSVAIMS